MKLFNQLCRKKFFQNSYFEQLIISIIFSIVFKNGWKVYDRNIYKKKLLQDNFNID